VLEHELQEAVAREEFERAAALRDQLRQLRAAEE
jgi:protein-arginine kinase activator protein McsA